MDRSLHYYDLILLAIILSVSLGIGIGAFTSVSMPVAVSILGVIAVSLVGHAIFINGPVDSVEDLGKEVEVEELPAVETAAQLID